EYTLRDRDFNPWLPMHAVTKYHVSVGIVQHYPDLVRGEHGAITYLNVVPDEGSFADVSRDYQSTLESDEAVSASIDRLRASALGLGFTFLIVTVLLVVFITRRGIVRGFRLLLQ